MKREFAKQLVKTGKKTNVRKTSDISTCCDVHKSSVKFVNQSNFKVGRLLSKSLVSEALVLAFR